MKKPLAKYNMMENKVDHTHVSSIVWAAILDKRYKMEVVRTDGYKANFSIYDGESNDTEIYTEEVGLAFGARFGPDSGDLTQWQNKACEIVDAL